MSCNHLRKTLFCLYCCILLIGLQQALSHVISALADVAPPPPPVGSDLYPGSEITNVRMFSETVVIEVGEDSPYPAGHAAVTAEFQMRNLGDTVEEMNVRFPLNHSYFQIETNECEYSGMDYPAIEDIAIWVDGRQVAVTKTSESFNWYYYVLPRFHVE